MKPRLQKNIRLTAEQDAAITANAAAQGVTPSRLMRDLGATGRCAVTPSINRSDWAALARVMADYNQNTRTLNVCRIQIDKGTIPEELLDTLLALQESSEKLYERTEAIREALVPKP